MPHRGRESEGVPQIGILPLFLDSACPACCGSFGEPAEGKGVRGMVDRVFSTPCQGLLGRVGGIPRKKPTKPSDLIKTRLR